MCEIPLLVMIHYKLRRLFLCSGGGYKHKRFLRQSWAYWSFRCCELVNSKMRATEVVRSEAMELELLQRWGHFKTAQKKYPPCPDKLSTGEGACSSAVSLAPAWHCVTLRDTAWRHPRPQGPLGPHTALQHLSGASPSRGAWHHMVRKKHFHDFNVRHGND